MRMRKLADGQSVMLCAPTEIHHQIVEHTRKSEESSIDVEDVLLWSMANTHEYTKKCVPLWAIQGMRHQKRIVAWNGDGDSQSILEPEAKTVEEWYKVRKPESGAKWPQKFGDNVISGRPEEVAAIRAKMVDFGAISVDGAALHEEQERELSPESELERQLERPPKMTPATHILHDDLVRMIKQGRLNPYSSAFIPAFDTLKTTTAANVFDLSSWPQGILATEDFARTIQAPTTQKLNDFTRSPQWILSSSKLRQVYAIISPFEANELHNLIRNQTGIVLHVYSPRIRESMLSLDELRYCSIPSQGATSSLPSSSIKNDLNLFAGQLYFSNREEYVLVCRHLGLASHAPGDNIKVSTDGFVDPKDREMYDREMARDCKMVKSPVDMLRALLEMRRKGQGFGKTHMGLLLDGELIKDRDFQG